jgi:hypothetical protein
MANAHTTKKLGLKSGALGDKQLFPLIGHPPFLFFIEGSCLIYVICVCLRIVVSNSYCVVLQLCFVVRCLVYPMLLIFSGLSFVDCPFGIL